MMKSAAEWAAFVTEADSVERREELGRAGAIGEVVKTLRDTVEDTNITVASLDALARLLGVERVLMCVEPNVALALQEGVPEAVMAVLRRCKDREDQRAVTRSAFTALRRFVRSTDAAAVAAVVAAGFIDVLCEALQTRGASDAELAECCLSMICNFARADAWVVDCRFVIDAMAQHPTAAPVQESGCCALRNIVARHVENSKCMTPAIETCEETVLRAMHTLPDNSVLQQHACGALGALAALARRVSVEPAVINEAVVASVVAALGRHGDSSAVAKEACGAVFRASIQSRAAAASFVRAGSVALIADAMRRHIANSQVQLYGCAALIKLQPSADVETIADADAAQITAAVAAMRAHPDDAEISSLACELLCVQRWSPAAVTLVEEQGAVEIVVAAMTRHHVCTRVQECGSLLIRLLGNTLRAVAARVIAAGGAAVLCSLARHESVLLRDFACAALWHLLDAGAACKAAVAAAGATDALLAALRSDAVHEIDGDPANLRASLASHVCRGLTCLTASPLTDPPGPVNGSYIIQGKDGDASDTQRAAAIFDAGGVPLLVQTLEAHMESAEVVSSALGALTNLSQYKAAARAALDHETCVATIFRALRRHADVLETQECGAAVFINLTHPARAYGVISGCGGVDTIGDMMQRHASSDVLHRRWCIVLQQLVRNSDTPLRVRRGIRTNGCISAIVAMLRIRAADFTSDGAREGLHALRALFELDNAKITRPTLANDILLGVVLAVLSTVKRYIEASTPAEDAEVAFVPDGLAVLAILFEHDADFGLRRAFTNQEGGAVVSRALEHFSGDETTIKLGNAILTACRDLA